MNSLSKLSIATAFIIQAGAPGQGAAFSEDICFNNPGVVNCMDARCAARGNSALCRANVMFDAAAATAALKGRSMIHLDSTFFIAQALGIRWDVAYWIAAYNEVTDLGQFTLHDRCGVPQYEDTQWRTAAIRGWTRLSVSTGGIPYHFSAPYQRLDTPGTIGISGVTPDLDDEEREGMLVHMRNWALDGGTACINGFTEPEGDDSDEEVYFQGEVCYRDNPLLSTEPSLVPKWIKGSVPALSGQVQLLPFQSYTGTQIANYTPTSDTSPYITNIVYADELERILSAGSGRLEGSDDPVPVELVRMGTYLHSLQDRISHHNCGDAAFVSGPDDDGLFEFHYDSVNCGQDMHAYFHYMEIGQSRLPERMYSALNYTWDELSLFRETFEEENPEWFEDAPAITKAKLIGTDSRPGIIPKVMRINDGQKRLDAMITAIEAQGLIPLPGNEGDTTCAR